MKWIKEIKEESKLQINCYVFKNTTKTNNQPALTSWDCKWRRASFGHFYTRALFNSKQQWYESRLVYSVSSFAPTKISVAFLEKILTLFLFVAKGWNMLVLPFKSMMIESSITVNVFSLFIGFRRTLTALNLMYWIRQRKLKIRTSKFQMHLESNPLLTFAVRRNLGKTISVA